jgi:endonuclease/exonuclease/phosphatase family metal-dependent hydrolase
VEACLLRVMTFNVRGSNYRDGLNVWENRAPLNVETIKHYALHLIGFQELQGGNLETYQEKLPEYDYVLGPEASDKAPHQFNAIFYDPERLEVLDSGGFWLSKTPERLSASWRTSCIRSANWVNLRCPDSGLSFLHLNTHLDHVSHSARLVGSRLILRKIAEMQKVQEKDLPAIVTGDFNCTPDSLPYSNFMEDGFVDTYLAAGSDTGPPGTFHAFEGSRYTETGLGPERIDWVLLRDPRHRIRVLSQLTVRDHDRESGIYPSDHYPVLAELVLAGPPQRSNPTRAS